MPDATRSSGVARSGSRLFQSDFFSEPNVRARKTKPGRQVDPRLARVVRALANLLVADLLASADDEHGVDEGRSGATSTTSAERADASHDTHSGR